MNPINRIKLAHFAELLISSFLSILGICACGSWFMWSIVNTRPKNHVLYKYNFVSDSFSTYILLSCHAELYFRVVPCNLGCRMSSPHDTACRAGLIGSCERGLSWTWATAAGVESSLYFALEEMVDTWIWVASRVFWELVEDLLVNGDPQ